MHFFQVDMITDRDWVYITWIYFTCLITLLVWAILSLSTIIAKRIQSNSKPKRCKARLGTCSVGDVVFAADGCQYIITEICSDAQLVRMMDDHCRDCFTSIDTPVEMNSV